MMNKKKNIKTFLKKWKTRIEDEYKEFNRIDLMLGKKLDESFS